MFEIFLPSIFAVEKWLFKLMVTGYSTWGFGKYLAFMALRRLDLYLFKFKDCLSHGSNLKVVLDRSHWPECCSSKTENTTFDAYLSEVDVFASRQD